MRTGSARLSLALAQKQPAPPKHQYTIAELLSLSGNSPETIAETRRIDDKNNPKGRRQGPPAPGQSVPGPFTSAGVAPRRK